MGVPSGFTPHLPNCVGVALPTQVYANRQRASVCATSAGKQSRNASDEVDQQGQNNGEVRAFFGRRRYLANIYSTLPGTVAEARRHPVTAYHGSKAPCKAGPSGLPKRAPAISVQRVLDGAKMPFRPHPSVCFPGSVTENFESLGGFIFSHGQGRIAPLPFDFILRRAPGVERLLMGHPCREATMAADRRELSDAEKAQVRARFENCYICGETLNDYEPTEIQYDHIYAFADGYSQDLSNFAPVHASREPNKRNCHKQKGRKSPFEYKEELRIRGEMQNVSGLRDICPAAASSEVTIDEARASIRFNGHVLPLYNQRLDNKDHLYFFDEIETRYIENDDKIQPRPLEEKIYAMIIHLRSHVQLLPSLGRLDLGERKVKIFDGQHKAVAQIKGNRRDRIPCIVFVNEDVEQLRKTVFAAHTDFLQQRYKKIAHRQQACGDFRRTDSTVSRGPR